MEVKESLYTRLELLESSQVISGEIADGSKKAVDLILEVKPKAEQSKLEMFTTHLAMAGQRVVDGQEQHPLDEDILEEMKTEDVYEEAVALRDGILKNFKVEFPESEKNFLSVHLCSLLM